MQFTSSTNARFSVSGPTMAASVACAEEKERRERKAQSQRESQRERETEGREREGGGGESHLRSELVDLFGHHRLAHLGRPRKVAVQNRSDHRFDATAFREVCDVTR